MEFPSSIESVDEVTKKIKVTIPQDQIEKELQVELANTVKKTKLNGFRPGKAPVDLVKKMYGERVRLEVIERLIGKSLDQAFTEHKLEVVGRPDVKLDSSEPGKQLEYTASVSVYPKPEIKNYHKFKIELPKKEVKDEDVQATVDSLKESKASLKRVELREVAQKGDVLDLSVIFLDDANKDTPRPEQINIEIGAGKLPKEIEEGLVGLKVTESREITVPGQKADPEKKDDKDQPDSHYKFTLNAISEKVLPEENDEFAKSVNYGVETLLELRTKIRSRLEEELKQAETSELHTAILEELNKTHEFLVPQLLIDDEIRSFISRSGVYQNAKEDIKNMNVEPFREAFSEMAIKRVKSAILIDRICETEKLMPTSEDLEKHMQEMAEKNYVSVDELKKYLAKERLMTGVMVELMRGKTLDFLAEKAEVSYVEPKEEKEPKEKKAKKK